MFFENPLICYDLETTGLNPNTDRICEFAFLRFHRGEVTDSLVSLVDPGVPIPEEATRVNGISNYMVAGKPTFGSFYPKIRDFIGSNMLVGHNCKNFDERFLQNATRLLGSEWPGPGVHVVDTLHLARRSGMFTKNTLSYICDRLGIHTEFHRAEGDAWATGKILPYLAEYYR